MRLKIGLVVGAGTIMAGATVAAAGPTQEEVFQSINQNVGSTVDISKAFPYAVAALAVVILLVWVAKRKQRQVLPRMLHHHGKLVREVSKKLKLRSIDIKSLKVLAEEQELSSPLTLLLCPSLLAKAVRTRNPRVDRQVLVEIVQRLRSVDFPARAVDAPRESR